MSTKVIKLFPAAKTALKFAGPSDKRLEEILQRDGEHATPTRTESRWMAGHILEMNGYKLEG